MAHLTAAARRKIPKSKFAVPGGVRGHNGPNFPLDTAAHDRAAIDLAPRSEAAGNISPSTEQRIVSEARQKLGVTKPAARKSAPKPESTRKANAARVLTSKAASARKAMGF